MAILISDLKFPGLTAWIDASATVSQGVTPSRFTVTVPPSFGTIQEVGDLTFIDGRQTITFKDCKVEDLQGQASIQSQGGTLVFEDRRWRWEFPTVSGRYNVTKERANTVPLVPIPGIGQGNPDQLPPPDPRGTEPIDPRTKKNARELAILCLKAMRETNCDVSAVPSDAYPTIEWDATNAAQALQSLVESLGCRVCLQPIRNRVLVAKQGIGQQLPDGPQIAISPKLKVRARPSRVRVLYARSRYQLRFALGCVNRDFDNSWRWIDDLSYKPSGGWTAIGLTFTESNMPTSLPGSRTRKDAAALAQSMYTSYRIKPTTPTGGPLRVPPFDSAARSGQTGNTGKASQKKVEQIRLLPILNATTLDDLGRVQTVAARCFGKHSPPDRTKVGQAIIQAYSDTTHMTEVAVPFSVDAEHQLITFSKRVYSHKPDGKIYPAEIVLECACEVEDNDTHQFVRFFRDLIIPGGLDTAPAEFVKEDLIYEYTAHYGTPPNGIDVPIRQAHHFSHHTSNADIIKTKADFYLRGEAQRYQSDEADDRSYPGLLAIEPDGAIQQVTWSLAMDSLSNPSTRASRNTEHNLYVPSHEGRRQREETNLNALRRAKEEEYRRAHKQSEDAAFA